MGQISMGAFEIEGRVIHLSNLEKVLYPAGGFTKAGVIDYYIRISPVLLPHLKGRPITMKRYPDGVEAEHFYEKQAPRHTPEWVQTVAVESEGRRQTIDYILINDLATLVWSANLANLELHTFLGSAPHVDVPDMVVFDLDPGAPADILQCARTGLWIREIMDALGLECFAKTSGSKGMQLYVPLHTAADFPGARAFAKAMAEWLEQQHPDTVVSTVSKKLREGRVFIDWSQNAHHKTTICVYSLRAREQPYVSTPVTWEEMETALKKGDPMRLYFLPEQALRRMEKMGDLFEKLPHLKQKLPQDFAEKAARLNARSGKSLGAYRAKRDFTRTREPVPAVEAKTGRELMYVIQKHQASHLHYDFRLEMQGVLRSWAAPKGIPTTRLDKRMAFHVEDHPMEYAKFEGTIPPGNYGAGTVMVWDIGTYTVQEGDPVRAYYAGKLHLILKGKKLNGEWVLVRIGKKQSSEGKEWLLMKAGADMKAISAKIDDQSVLTGRRLKKIASDNDAQWISGRKAERSKATARWKPFAATLRSLPEAAPKFVDPMLCKPAARLPEGENWLYEVKFDGYRAEIVKDGSKVAVLSRNNKDLSRQYPEIVQSALAMTPERMVLDGEVVALAETGVPSFQLLQSLGTGGDRPLYYYAFDLLHLDGRTTTGLPLVQRKKMLESLCAGSDGTILFASGLEAEPEVLVAEIRKMGLEGVVAKQKNSPYEPGRRSGEWVKFKAEREDEFVIGGYKPSGKKNDFDALLVGQWEGKKLRFVGRLRAGFTAHAKKEVGSAFSGLETKANPFFNLPEERKGKWGDGITVSEMGAFRWLKPKLVCIVRFVEWTAERHLRHAEFVKLQ